jgi:hypothetical protein
MNDIVQCEFKTVLEWANAAFAMLAVIFRSTTSEGGRVMSSNRLRR